MIREVKFESQDRRIKQIIAALNENGIKTSKKLTQSAKLPDLILIKLVKKLSLFARKCKMGLRSRLRHRS